MEKEIQIETKLSRDIERQGFSYASTNSFDYVYKFRCSQLLEAIGNFEYFNIDYNDTKETVINSLVDEFRWSLNTVIFGDPAGRGYIEMLEQQKRDTESKLSFFNDEYKREHQKERTIKEIIKVIENL